jgi:ATP-dependent Clp protease adaptor protein ClpS
MTNLWSNQSGNQDTRGFEYFRELAASLGWTHIPVLAAGPEDRAGTTRGRTVTRRFGSWPRVHAVRTSLSGFRKRTSNTPVMLCSITSFDPHQLSIAAFPPRMANDENRSGGTGGPAASVITKVKPKTKRPNLYRVLILNDDYTPMEFVVHVLEKFFQKDLDAATKIMLHVHHHGIGECGIFTYEIAETKVTQVMDFARKHQHPLQCVMEKK